MNYLEARAAVDRGAVQPIYILHGGEGYLQTELVLALKSALVAPGMEDFSYQRLEGPEADLEAVIQTCRTPAFVGGSRLVVVDRHPVLESAGADQEEDRLIEYSKRPSRDAYLVFCVGKKPDRRRRLFRDLSGFLVDCSDLSGRDLDVWMDGLLSDRGYRMKAGARRQLAATVGNSMPILARELDKLMTHAGPGGEITAGDVSQVAAGLPQETVFRLVDAICERRVDRALEILADLRVKGEPVPRILFMLARQLRLIRLAGEMLGEKKSPPEMARELGQHPFVMKKSAAQWRRFDRDQLVRGLFMVMETDYRLKTGQMKEDLAMERLVVDLARL